MPNDSNQSTDPQGQNNQDNLEIIDPDDLKHQQSKPPSVVGEEDVFSGDAPAEPADIDEELEKIGRHGDEEGVKPVGVTSESQEEQ